VVVSLDDYHALEQSALPIMADRVAFPSDPGGVRLLDLLPPDLANLYSSPNHLIEEQPELRKKHAHVRPAVFAVRDQSSLLRMRWDPLRWRRITKVWGGRRLCGSRLVFLGSSLCLS